MRESILRLLAPGFEPECHGLHRAPYQLGYYKHTSRRLRRLLGFEITKKSQEYIHDIRTFARISYYHYSTVKGDMQ